MWEAIQVKRVTNFCNKNAFLHLTKSVETFFMVSINDRPTIKYWQNLGKIMDTAKYNIPKQCRIGDICLCH